MFFRRIVFESLIKRNFGLHGLIKPRPNQIIREILKSYKSATTC